MKTLRRHILGELASYLLIALFFLTFLLFLDKAFRFTDLVVNRGAPLWLVARFLFAALPALLLATLPIAVLVACIMTFARLSGESELLAMNSTGMSFYSQLAPVGVVGGAAALLSGFLMTFALPWSQEATIELARELLRSRAAAFEVREGVFNDGFDGVVIYVREVEQDGRVMKGIMISDARHTGEKRVIFAERGTLLRSPESSKVWLRLAGGSIHTTTGAGKSKPAARAVSLLPEGRYQVARFGTYDLNLDLTSTIEKTKALRKSLRSLPLAELRRELARRKPGTSRYNAVLIELHKKFAVPLTCLILAFLGAPLGVQNRRAGRHGGFALSLGMLILYYILSTFAEGMGESGQLPAWLAVWGANALLALVAGYIVRAVARRGALDLWRLLSRPLGPLAHGRY